MIQKYSTLLSRQLACGELNWQPHITKNLFCSEWYLLFGCHIVYWRVNTLCVLIWCGSVDIIIGHIAMCMQLLLRHTCKMPHWISHVHLHDNNDHHPNTGIIIIVPFNYCLNFCCQASFCMGYACQRCSHIIKWYLVNLVYQLMC